MQSNRYELALPNHFFLLIFSTCFSLLNDFTLNGMEFYLQMNTGHGGVVYLLFFFSCFFKGVNGRWKKLYFLFCLFLVSFVVVVLRFFEAIFIFVLLFIS